MDSGNGYSYNVENGATEVAPILCSDCEAEKRDFCICED